MLFVSTPESTHAAITDSEIEVEGWKWRDKNISMTFGVVSISKTWDMVPRLSTCPWTRLTKFVTFLLGWTKYSVVGCMPSVLILLAHEKMHLNNNYNWRQPNWTPFNHLGTTKPVRTPQPGHWSAGVSWGSKCAMIGGYGYGIRMLWLLAHPSCLHLGTCYI